MSGSAGIAHQAIAPRIMVMLFALVALAVQSFVIQTHIHIPQGGGRAQSVSLITLAAAALSEKAHAAGDTCTSFAPLDKYPINEDPSNCPLCQEISHSGQFIHNAAVLAALSFAVTVNFVIFDEGLPSFLAVSHIWHGRAPPLRSKTI